MARSRRRSTSSTRSKTLAERLKGLGIAVAVLFALLICGVVAYVWFMGQQAPSSNVSKEDSTPARRVESSTPTMAENAPVGVYIQSFPDEVGYGDTANVQVHTRVDATCSVTIKYNQKDEVGVGLEDKTASKYGLVSWNWVIDTSIPPGTWPVTVTCAYGDKSGVMTQDLTVQ